MKTVPQVTAQQAQAAVNLFISDYVGDRFTADQAQLSVTGEVWQVPIILAYPMIGSLGQVGFVLVSTSSEAIISHTPFDEIKQVGLKLYEVNRDAIQTHFS
ncbi:hypothetical protein DSM106972_028590 [Dulcicalothrix desertica PCC 7102]|uniref:Uncharacterized protein n=1 Tax=Dulcicalothrix desertica PCC 7102 TaxID=232991 RepID=A0A3S5K3D1_9CYAN|nr:hypothetical protein [Dulcicalothrix desertica]RUT06602.1 hypothetical protein DSM106972_028590 [Dulcicalothrix desertica PCC 7102]TWH50287.1 hypothetical protein CAL7102_04581 [Dulcicalothrix desertica PCC 7102]